MNQNGKHPLYARINVSRGVVTWSIAHSGRGAQSTGSSEAERISEVVSDVVESQSGYLDITLRFRQVGFSLVGCDCDSSSYGTRVLLPLAQASTDGLRCVPIKQDFGWMTGLP